MKSILLVPAFMLISIISPSHSQDIYNHAACAIPAGQVNWQAEGLLSSTRPTMDNRYRITLQQDRYWDEKFASDENGRGSFGGGVGIEAFGAKGKAALLGYNIRLTYLKDSKISWSVYFKRGDDMSGFGAVESSSNRDRLLEYLNESGFLVCYRISRTLSGPYLGAGLSYLNASKGNEEIINLIGMPLEAGLTVKLARWIGFNFAVTGNVNKDESYYGLNFSLNFGK